MLLAQPAEGAPCPEVIEALAAGGIGALEEGAVAGEIATRTERVRDLADDLVLVGDQVDGIAEEDGVYAGKGGGQVVDVALLEGDGAASQPVARHVNRLEGRLDANHAGGAAQPLQLVQHELGHPAGAAGQLPHAHGRAAGPIGIQPLQRLPYERGIDILVKLMPRARIESIAAGDSWCLGHDSALTNHSDSGRRAPPAPRERAVHRTLPHGVRVCRTWQSFIRSRRRRAACTGGRRAAYAGWRYDTAEAYNRERRRGLDRARRNGSREARLCASRRARRRRLPAGLPSGR